MRTGNGSPFQLRRDAGPVKATTAGATARRTGPRTFISSSGAPGGFPTKPVRQRRGGGVQRTAACQAEAADEEAAAVDHEIEQAGLVDGQPGVLRLDGQQLVRLRLGRVGSVAGLEHDGVARLEQHRRFPVGIVDRLERRPEQAPAARRRQRVDAGLGARQGDGVRRDAGPRLCAARPPEGRVDLAQEREPGREPQRVDAVGHAGVPAHDLLERETRFVGHLPQVGPVVADREMHGPAGLGLGVFRRGVQPGTQPTLGQGVPVELHVERGVRGNDVEDARRGVGRQGPRDGVHPSVDLRVDAAFEAEVDAGRPHGVRTRARRRRRR